MSTAVSGTSELLNSLNKNTFYSDMHAKQNNSISPSITKSGGDVSIGILTPEKTQALLNSQIAEKLKERFGEEGIELQGLQAEDFTPEKVSERILGFVSGRILSEQDKDKQAELMSQAREGIERGFDQAKDILESLDVLNGKVKDDISSTYDLIQQGLGRLEDQMNGVVSNELETKQEASGQVQQASMQNSYSRNENTQIEIITNDGDKVLIDVFKQQSAQSSQSYSRNDEGMAYSESRNISASTGLSYQVKGELDEDEQKAIDDLLKDIARVSDSFFSGEVQNAFDLAVKMDFDSEELTRFSLNMDYQETRQVAISTYNNVQAQPDREALRENPGQGHAYGRDTAPGQQQFEPNALKDMSSFINELDKVFQNPFVMHKFNQPEEGIGGLLKEMNQLLHADEMEQLKEESSSLLDSLVEQLKNNHSNDAQTELASTTT
ncbi:MAG: DUF5610 domain-containing protein [Proteobacteria bacterium]|nr:DUF5610 domain-containing protein [Pseudomonadota bacterium]